MKFEKKKSCFYMNFSPQIAICMLELSSLFLLYTSFFNVFIFEWPATNMLVVIKFFFKSDPIHAYITTHWVDHKASKELWTQVSPLLVTFQAHISWRSSGVWGTRSLSPCFSTYTSIELLSALPMHYYHTSFPRLTTI